MKANELRIGNLIKHHDKTITVAGIVRNTIYYESKELCFDSNIGEYNPFQPIQLTEEWLLKFGFVEEFENKFYKDSIAIEVFENECILYIGYFVDLAINYVHQLQNLHFALTGEELAVA